jgi:hypothetical protein
MGYSGALEQLQARYRSKIRQIRENPYVVEGCVIIVGFVLRRIVVACRSFVEAKR